MSDRACQATTRTGDPCKAHPLADGDFCLAHSDPDTRASVGFTADAGHLGGRPRNPRAVDVLREKIEQDIDSWLQVLVDAREAESGIVVGNGASASLETLPDHSTRIKAFLAAFDRAYGRPRQALEHTGEDGGPIQVTAFDLSRLEPEEKRALLALVEKAERGHDVS